MIVMPTTIVIRQDRIKWIHFKVDSDSGAIAKQDRPKAILLAELSIQFRPTTKAGLPAALQPDKIDQVLLGYLYSGAAFS
jgi:hypothetical protein